MKTNPRSALLEAIAELCIRFPHWRFGQLVANAAGWADVEVWEINDEQLLASIQSYLNSQVPGVKPASPQVPSSETAVPATDLREG